MDSSLCPNCHNKFPCECAKQLHQLFISLTSTNNEKPLDAIENLIFSGGGVKGVAYLGCLRQLEAQNQGFLKRVKRVAGASAGSMVSLYLALELKIDDIEKYITQSFKDLLDDGLPVVIETSWHGFNKKQKYYNSNDIVIKTISLFDTFKDRMMQAKVKKDAKLKEQTKQDIGTFFSSVTGYFVDQLGTAYSILFSMFSSTINGIIANFLSSSFSPAEDEPVVVKAPQEEEKVKGSAHVDPHGRVFKKKPTDDQKSTTPSNTTSTTTTSTTTEDQETEKNFNQECLDMLSEALKNADGHSKNYKPKEETKTEENVNPEDEEQLLGAAPSSNPTMAAGNPDDLSKDMALLGSCFGGMLYQVLFAKDDSTKPYGIFDATKIKDKLIDDPIRLAKFDPEKLTFKDLAASKKQLYLTTYNTALKRTEVFSPYHSPDALVADAVRASMSIPAFFTPVNIRYGSPLVKKQTYKTPDVGLPTFYMDGGCLDNYPIWLFDDLRYLVDSANTMTDKRSLGVRNPRTLGFKLGGDDEINVYMNPGFSTKDGSLKQKMTNSKKRTETFNYYVGSLLDSFLDGAQENAYYLRRDYSRTVYVNNMGFSAVSFNLDDKQKGSLVDAGKRAVNEYLTRAKNGFKGEECY